MLNRFLTGQGIRLVYPLCLIALFMTLWVFAGCASKLTPPDYNGGQLHFGQGGGFTGDVSYFILLDDGRVYRKEVRDSTYVLHDTWKQNFTDQMFHNYETLEIEKMDFYHPGNLYYFIEKHERNTPAHRISWGQAGYTMDQNITTFYHLLYKSTKPKS